MLERSLSVMIFAILPVALSRFELSTGVVWSACALLFVGAAPFLHWMPILRLRRLPEYRPSVAYQAAGHILLALSVGLLLSGLVGLLPLVPAYGVALVVELAVAAGMFLRVASSLMGSHAPSSD